MPENEPPDEISSQDSSQDSQDEGFRLLQGPIPWARRLTPRAKLFRIAVLFGLALVTIGVVAGSSLIAQVFPQTRGSTTGNAASNLHTRLPFPTFPAMSLRATLPSAAYTTPISLIHVAPGFSSNPFISPAWICWVKEPLIRSPESNSLLHISRTLDGGQTWREIVPPITNASGCQIAVSGEDATTALLIADVGDGDVGPCTTSLLLTQDNGDSWRSIPPPQEYANDCAASYSLFASTIFASAGTDRATSTPRPVALWQVGDSSTWTTTFAGAGLVLTSVSGMRPGGKLLGAARFTDPHAVVGQLMESTNGGVSWSAMGSLPGPGAELFLEARTPDLDEPVSPVYATSVKSQSAQNLPTRALWRWNDERRQWVALPDIPRVVSVPEPLAQPDTAVVGVGPDGGLLVSAPITASLNEEPASRSFWYWEDRAQRWIRNEAASAPGAYLYGLGWSGNTATLWLIYLHLGIPPHLEMYTTRFSADSFGPK